MPVAAALCAVLVVGSPVDETGDAPLGAECPLHLTPLLGKNPLIYAVETLVASGIRRIICLGWDEPVRSQQMLGDGQRWGCQIEWHSLSGPHQVFDRLVDVAPPSGPFLLANTRCLMLPPLQEAPPAPGTVFVPQGPAHEAPMASSPVWGWAWIGLEQCQAMAHRSHWHGWVDALSQVCPQQHCVPALDLADGGALLRAIEPMLTRQFPVVIDGSEIEPGIFVSRNVVIHPTAQIQAPLYLGADVELGSNCRIGPGVAIGRQSHVGPDCEIVHAQLGPDSWLGRSLDVKGALVWRGLVWSDRHQARMPIVDAGLLSQGSPHWKWHRVLARLSGRFVAACLCLLFLPLLIVLGLACRLGRPAGARTLMVDPARARLSDPTRPYATWFGAHPQTRGWRHAVGFVLPNLWGVVLGRWCLVGLRPRTPAQWVSLPPDHQHWLAGRACGLIQEEWLLGSADADTLHSMVLDRYQDMRSKNLLYPWGLIGRYLLLQFRSARRSAPLPAQGKLQWN